MSQDALYYIGQKAFIRKENSVLVLTSPLYGLDFPGGKVKEGEENFIEALQREVREETNLEIAVGDPFARWAIHFTDKEGIKKQIFLIGYECTYVSGNVALSNEHTSFQWIDKDSYKLLPERNNYFLALEKYFMRDENRKR